MLLRRYTFKLYPNASQEAALRDQARSCAVLWNALLEMRETHYRRAKLRGDKKTSLTAFDQGKDITALNKAAREDAALAEWREIPRGTQERVADMLDLAMKAFFKRAKSGAGAASGYPRYKSTRHADSIPLREPAKSCWKFWAHSAPVRKDEPKGGGESSRARGEEGGVEAVDQRRHWPPRARGEEGRMASNWRLTLRGVPGAIKARGKFPIDPEAFKTADVKFYDGGWWFSICVEIAARRSAGKQKLKVELDLIDEFAVVKTANGQCVAGLSDPFSSGRKGEFPDICSGLQESPCGVPADAGGTQAVLALAMPASPCGVPADAGGTQGSSFLGLEMGPCGVPADAGGTQEQILRRDRNEPCGVPADAAQVDKIQSSRDRRYKRGSIRWRREKQRIARIKARQARRTKEALHKWTTEIVRRAAELMVIAPPVKQMTKTGRGDEKFHGAEVQTVAALNRRVLSMAPASAVQMLEYKAAEAGVACVVERREDHQIRVGGELKSAAIANRRAKRVTKRKQKVLEAAE